MNESLKNPWVLISVIIPPLSLFAVGIYYFISQERDNFDKKMVSFNQRQNKVLAYDAVETSGYFVRLFEKAGIDVKTLAQIPSTQKSFTRFRNNQKGQIRDYSHKQVKKIWVSYYNSMAVINLKGNHISLLENGKHSTGPTLEQCKDQALCDHQLIKALQKEIPGQLVFGTLKRWYSTKDEPENEKGATWRVGIKINNGIYVLGIDYRHLKNILYNASFPYTEKRNLLTAYSKGEYIYFVDDQFNIILHPKYWHIPGMNPNTDTSVNPALVDKQIGYGPLNLKLYQGEKLKSYFNRLLNVSFRLKGVDLFRAPNLTGRTRVLSVAPLKFSFDGIKKTLGHVIVGCNVEQFEEPKETMILPL
jgi:hypothetical protein